MLADAMNGVPTNSLQLRNACHYSSLPLWTEYREDLARLLMVLSAQRSIID
jgi:hypothetical protein